jgi:hypothetical protein
LEHIPDRERDPYTLFFCSIFSIFSSWFLPLVLKLDYTTIPDIQESKIGRITIQGQPQQKTSQTPSQAGHGGTHLPSTTQEA